MFLGGDTTELPLSLPHAWPPVVAPCPEHHLGCLWAARGLWAGNKPCGSPWLCLGTTTSIPSTHVVALGQDCPRCPHLTVPWMRVSPFKPTRSRQ